MPESRLRRERAGDVRSFWWPRTRQEVIETGCALTAARLPNPWMDQVLGRFPESFRSLGAVMTNRRGCVCGPFVLAIGYFKTNWQLNCSWTTLRLTKLPPDNGRKRCQI